MTARMASPAAALLVAAGACMMQVMPCGGSIPLCGAACLGNPGRGPHARPTV